MVRLHSADRLSSWRCRISTHLLELLSSSVLTLGLAIYVLSGTLCNPAMALAYTAAFTQISTSNTPGAPLWRGWTAMTWGPSLNRIVMWGGSGGDFFNDVQALDPLNAGWITLDAQTYCPGNTSFLRPNASDESGVTWDSLTNRLWIYNGGSGYRCASPQNVGRAAGAGTTSTAIVDPTLTSAIDNFYKDWQVRAPDGTKAFVTAYSAATKTLSLGAPLNVSAGGAYDLYVDFGDGTWWYDYVSGQYSKLQQTHWGYTGYVPPARKSPGFAGDGKKAFLFGGLEYDNATYKLDFATRSYSIAIPRNSAASPAARGQIQNQFVYDSTHDLYLLFGGRCYDPARCAYGAVLSDTWIYDAVENVWTPIIGGTHPPARNQGQMYFDQANGVVVLYGGTDGTTVFNDVWTFDLGALAWTQQTIPPVNPGGVYLGQVAYAPTSKCGYLVYGVTTGGVATGGTWKLCLFGTTGNQPPQASFTATPTTAVIGAPIALSATASSDPDGSIVSYAWSFGDGSTGSGATTSKSYPAAGNYTITLTVTDNGGSTASSAHSVTIVSDQPPVANFSATPTPTTTGAPISFSGSASFDPDGSIVSYAWNFGDGTSGNGVTASKSYTTAGTYTVKLTVTDNAGATGSATGTVTITTAGSGSTTVWLEDALPPRAGPGGNEAFTWISANPAPFSGTKAHQSVLMAGTHQHYFAGASPAFTVRVGDTLFTYIYLDPLNPPREVMLQWYDGSSWEHRAYWGAKLIPWGSAGGPGGQYMGGLPAPGQWIRLEVPAAWVGLEGRSVTGMAFALYDGRATWDLSGVASP